MVVAGMGRAATWALHADVPSSARVLLNRAAVCIPVAVSMATFPSEVRPTAAPAPSPAVYPTGRSSAEQVYAPPPPAARSKITAPPTTSPPAGDPTIITLPSSEVDTDEP